MQEAGAHRSGERLIPYVVTLGRRELALGHSCLPFILNYIDWTGEMAQPLKAHTAFVEVLGLVPSTQIRLFTTAVNSSSRGIQCL